MNNLRKFKMDAGKKWGIAVGVILLVGAAVGIVLAVVLKPKDSNATSATTTAGAAKAKAATAHPTTENLSAVEISELKSLLQNVSTTEGITTFTGNVIVAKGDSLTLEGYCDNARFTGGSDKSVTGSTCGTFNVTAMDIKSPSKATAKPTIYTYKHSVAGDNTT